jgi:hypothetical protein
VNGSVKGIGPLTFLLFPGLAFAYLRILDQDFSGKHRKPQPTAIASGARLSQNQHYQGTTVDNFTLAIQVGLELGLQALSSTGNPRLNGS